MTYVVLCHQEGVDTSPMGPEAPKGSPNGNKASTVADAKWVLKNWCRRMGADFDSRVYADVYYASSWDGVSYGDMMAFRLTVGPRGGITKENA